MRLTEGSPGSRILAFGGYQPSNVLTNEELAATVDTSDEWIRSRVGIASRRLAGRQSQWKRFGTGTAPGISTRSAIP